MRKQTGCIYANGDNWCLRWREGEGEARKLRFKMLTPVTSEHRKSRERKTGTLRIPDEVQAMANAVLGVVNTSPRRLRSRRGAPAVAGHRPQDQLLNFVPHCRIAVHA